MPAHNECGDTGIRRIDSTRNYSDENMLCQTNFEMLDFEMR